MAMIWLRLKGWILAAAGVVLGALSIYFAGRMHGYDDAETDAREADNAQARKIEDLADRVRRADGNNLTAIERLRRAKKLRDL